MQSAQMCILAALGHNEHIPELIDLSEQPSSAGSVSMRKADDIQAVNVTLPPMDFLPTSPGHKTSLLESSKHLQQIYCHATSGTYCFKRTAPNLASQAIRPPSHAH